MIFSRTLILALLMLLLLACGESAPTAPLSLDHGWVRAMPPGVGMTAAYGRFINSSAAAIEISSFASDSFEDLSIHQTTTEDGISKMRLLKSWSIEAGATAVLQPGGVHLMLMGPTREIVTGSVIELTLHSATGENYKFLLPVEAR